MIAMNRPGIAIGLLLSLGLTRSMLAQTSGSTPPPPPPGRVASPTLEGPVTDLEPIRPDDTAVQNSRAAEQDSDAPAATHDALQDNGGRSRATECDTPRATAASDRRAAVRPTARSARHLGAWLLGLGSARAEFVWIGGVWQVPPPGSMWVTARWRRDQVGWYRTPGFWSRRRDNGAITTTYSTANQPAWRTTGPPAGHPDDLPAAAPGPDYFYVPCHYAPAGDQLRWTPGFWRGEAGWDWIRLVGFAAPADGTFARATGSPIRSSQMRTARLFGGPVSTTAHCHLLAPQMNAT